MIKAMMKACEEHGLNDAKVEGRFLFINNERYDSKSIPEHLTAPFNNMRTLKFKAQLKNAFFATVNQMFAGSSQLSTAAERVVIKSLCKVQATNRIRK